MTISTRTLGCLTTVAALALFTPVTAWAAPDADADADEVSEDVEEDVSEDDKDIDIEVDGDDDDDKGCTIATGVGQNLGGLLCTLGLLGWQLRRRRPA